MGFGKALKEILRFEVLWKLIVFCLITPLFRGVYHAYVSEAGLRYNGGVVWAFFSPKGALLFLLLFFGAAWLVFYEYSVIIRIVALCRQGERVTLRQVMRASLWDLGLLRGWSLPLGAVYYILLLPLVRAIYVSTMVPEVTIPWFIFGEMQKTHLGTLGIFIIYAAYFIAHLLLLFAPLKMVLHRQRFGLAAKESLCCWRTLGWKDRLTALGMHAAWSWAGTELARYWRRNLLDSSDFDKNFLKYLLYSEAFRKDLLYWLLLALLQTAAMAGAVWCLTAMFIRTGEARVSQLPAWDRDGAAVWEILARRGSAWAARWQERMKQRRWRVGTTVLCLVLAAGLLLSLEYPMLVHPPLAIAHRGGTGGVENTLEAVLSAAEDGMDYAEIDVQLTRDGVPVLFHDGNLWRMAGRGASVGELTWAELQEYMITDNSHPEVSAQIASLEEVLQALSVQPGMGLLIELKPSAGGSEALANAVMDLVERYDFGERAMFMSLEYLCLLPLLERHPEWWVGFCAYGVAGDIDDAVWRYQVDFLAVEEALVSYQLVDQARKLNLPVYVWSVYDTEKMLQYLEMGVSGIITDYPEEVLPVLDAYERSHPDTEYIWKGVGLPRKDEFDFG